jgi:hypothetical protein
VSHLARPRIPPLPQQVEDLGRRHHVSVLATFRLDDADEDLLTVDSPRPDVYKKLGIDFG